MHLFQEHNVLGNLLLHISYYFVNSAHDPCFREFVVRFCFVEDLLTAKAKPPSEKEFADAFQKFKYIFSLLVSHEFLCQYKIISSEHLLQCKCMN